jgi:hypothetical protein
MNRIDKEAIILGTWLIFAIILVWFGFFTRFYDGGEYIVALILTGILSLCLAVLLLIWVEENEDIDEKIVEFKENLSKVREQLRKYEEEEEKNEDTRRLSNSKKEN